MTRQEMDTDACNVPGQEVENAEGAEMVWGEVLQAVGGGLQAARSFLWDGAARKLSTLLASPAAFEGEHFLQVPSKALPILLHY